MGRSDGTPVKGIPAIDLMIPHIMNRRTDSTNFVKVEIDITNLKAYLNDLRAQGHHIGIMDAVVAAFAFMLKKRPEVNRFVVNKRIYQRNHICVSFAMLKRGANELTETIVKVYIEPGDDLITISRKIRETIKDNEAPQVENAMDRFVNRLMSMPVLPGFLVRTIKFMDNRGILPKSIIKLSPFHSSMFISNLASIKMDYLYHHLYEFGTTSLFMTIGKPLREHGNGNGANGTDDAEKGKAKQVMTLGISMDERICIGAVWARAFYEFKRCLEHPAKLMGELADDENNGGEHVRRVL